MGSANSPISELGGGYSASVDLRLRVNGCTFPALQVGRDRVVLSEVCSLPEGPAEVIVIVDGVEDRFPVRIEDRGLVREVIPVVIEGGPGGAVA